jgi:hypothetical protein
VVEANDFWGFAFVKVALDGLTNLGVRFDNIVRFRKDRFSQDPRGYSSPLVHLPPKK